MKPNLLFLIFFKNYASCHGRHMKGLGAFSLLALLMQRGRRENFPITVIHKLNRKPGSTFGHFYSKLMEILSAIFLPLPQAREVPQAFQHGDILKSAKTRFLTGAHIDLSRKNIPGIRLLQHADCSRRAFLSPHEFP